MYVRDWIGNPADHDRIDQTAHPAVGQLMHLQACRRGHQVGAAPRLTAAARRAGGVIGRRQPSPARAGSAGAFDPVGLVTLATLLAVEVPAVGAVGAASDRPGAGGGLGGVAFAVQRYHHPGTQGRVVLGAAHPLGQLPTRPRPHWELAVVERHKQRIQARGSLLPTALAGRLGGALADGLGVARRHAQPMSLEGFAQRRPSGAQLGRCRVHRAEAFGELEGALGFGAIREEPARLPAHPLLGMQGPLVGVDEGSTRIRR
jgi:hypothetical protein